MTNFNQYFTHNKISETDSNIDKEQYFDNVEYEITQVTELLGSILYDLKATIYNQPDECGFEDSVPDDWKEQVVDGLETRASDAIATLNGLYQELDNIHSSMDKWDRQTFIDKLATA